MTGRITLKNMSFYGFHGHLPREAKTGQTFLVDVILDAEIGTAAESDALPHTADFAEVHRLCHDVMEGSRVNLVETLCARLLDMLLARFPTVRRAEVAIRKPSAPMPGALDYVEVRAAADRGGS
ncbi:MAG TPA: dihydroneopterin aldolase [Opitutaceae bacterium]